MVVRIWFIINLIFLANASLSVANNLSQSFVYSGTVRTSDGSSVVTGTVSFKFGIYDPTGTCLLYEETQTNIDLGTTGFFSLSIGSATGDAKRTANDPGLAMKVIMNNTAAGAIVANGANCSLVAGYTPAANENRLVRVTITKGADTAVLSPDLSLSPQGRTLVAQTIQGTDLTGLIQVAGNVTAANLATLTGGGDASSLHNHDSLYARIGAASFGIGDSTPDAAIEIETASPDLRLTGTANSGQTEGIYFYGGVGGNTNTASIRTTDNSTTLSFYTGTNLSLNIDTNQNTSFSASASSAKTVGLGRYTDAQEGTLTTALALLGSASVGVMWANSDSNSIKYWNGTVARTISSGAGGTGDFMKDGTVDMTGVFVGALGSVGAPGYSFSGDTNTGMYSSGADTIDFSAGGTKILSVDSTGVSSPLTLGLSNGAVSSGKLTMFESSTNGSNTLILKSPDSVSSDFTLTLPVDDGANGQFLTTNGSGVLSWAGGASSFLPLAGGTLTSNLTIGNGSSTAGRLILKEDADDGSETVTIQPQAMASSYTLTLPVDDGTANQYLKTDGSGNLSWSTISGSGDFYAAGTVPMTAPIQGSAGLVSAPGFSFSGDTNTGIYSPAADTIGLAANGALVSSVTSSGYTQNSGELTLNAQKDLRLADSDSSNYVALESNGTVTSNYTLTLPSALPASTGYIIGSNSSGTMSWTQSASAETVSTLAIRDASSRMRMVDPSANNTQEAATKASVTTQIGTYIQAAGDTATGALLNKASFKLEDPGAGTNKITIAAPTLSADYTLTLPVDDGTASQVLETNGSGTLGWVTPSGTDSTKVAKTGDTMTGTLVVGNGATSGGTVTLVEDTDLGSNTVSLVAPNVAGADYSITLPTAVPAANTSIMTALTSGVSSWTETATANTASKLAIRDASARAQFADPSAAQDVATKNYFTTNYLPLAGGTMTGNLTIGNGATSAGTLVLKEDSDDGSQTVTIAAQSMASSYNLTLPADSGTTGRFLAGTSSGELFWSQQKPPINARRTGTTNNTRNNTTTPTDDEQLKFSSSEVLANTTYEIRGLVGFSNATTGTPDIKFNLTFAGSPVEVSFGYICKRGTAETGYGRSYGNGTSTDTIDVTTAGISWCQIRGYARSGSSNANMALQWAQSTANASNSTIEVGSYINLNPVPSSEPAESWYPSVDMVFNFEESAAPYASSGFTSSVNFAGGASTDTTNFMQGSGSLAITTAGSNAGDTVNIGSDMTMGCWYRPTGYNFGNQFLLFGDNGGGGTITAALRLTSGGLLDCSNVASSYTATSTSVATLNTWTHLVCRSDSGTNKIEAFVNATNEGNVTGTMNLGLRDLAINHRSNALLRGAGSLDECFVKDGALTDAQICHICSCGIDGSLCTCDSGTYTEKGRNATYCGSCTLPTTCGAQP